MQDEGGGCGVGDEGGFGPGVGAGDGEGAGGVAACVTPTERPAMLTVAERALVPSFRTAASVRSSLRLPDDPDRVSHDTGELAVQLHPVSVVTWTSALLPWAAKATSPGLTAKVQGDAACVIATWPPLMVMLPVRTRPCGLAVAVRVSAASPCPDVGDTCTHDELVPAVHAHSRGATTGTSTFPPPAGMVGTVPSVDWQRGMSGAVNCVTLVDPHASVCEIG